jgi:hypothetical protein
MKRCVYIILLSCSVGFAQDFELDNSILNETAAGARPAAMGRAFTALSNDPAALAWNPAGLVRFNRNCAILSGSLNFGNINISPENPLVKTSEFSAHRTGGLSLNTVGFTIPIPGQNLNMVSSVIIHNLVDLNDDVTYKHQDSADHGVRDYRVNSSGGIFSLSPGIGIMILDDLFCGAALNFITGSHKRRFENRAENENIKTENWENWENKFSGFRVDFGFIWQVSKQTSLGSRIVFPYSLRFADIQSSNSNDQKREYDLDVALFLPAAFSAGIAITLTKDFLFAFDYRFKPWQKVKVKIDNLETDRVFASAHSFHMGIEYIIRTASYDLPWRFGFFSNPEQFFEYSSETPDNRGDQVSAHYVSGGMGISTRHFIFNITADYKLLQFKTVIPSFGSDLFDLRSSVYRITFGTQIYLD